jgi:hypothetical protein
VIDGTGFAFTVTGNVATARHPVPSATTTV